MSKKMMCVSKAGLAREQHLEEQGGANSSQEAERLRNEDEKGRSNDA